MPTQKPTKALPCREKSIIISHCVAFVTHCGVPTGTGVSATAEAKLQNKQVFVVVFPTDFKGITNISVN